MNVLRLLKNLFNCKVVSHAVMVRAVASSHSYISTDPGSSQLRITILFLWVCKLNIVSVSHLWAFILGMASCLEH